MTSSAHLIVFTSPGAKSGKTTTALHAAVGLLRLGYKVATIDLDAENIALTRYMANRFEYAELHSPDLPSPAHLEIEQDNISALKNHEKDGRDFLRVAIENLRPDFEFILIDTGAPEDFFTLLAESYSDTLISVATGSLAPLIATARRVRDLRQAGHARHWVISHNRRSAVDHPLPSVSLKNADLIAGFTERDLFPSLAEKGLSLLDMKEIADNEMNLGALMARQEVRHLLRAIAPEKLMGYPQKRRI